MGFYRDRDGPGSARPLRDQLPGYSTLPNTGQTASSVGHNRVWLARLCHIAGPRSARNFKPPKWSFVRDARPVTPMVDPIPTDPEVPGSANSRTTAATTSPGRAVAPSPMYSVRGGAMLLGILLLVGGLLLIVWGADWLTDRAIRTDPG